MTEEGDYRQGTPCVKTSQQENILTCKKWKELCLEETGWEWVLHSERKLESQKTPEHKGFIILKYLVSKFTLGAM